MKKRISKVHNLRRLLKRAGVPVLQSVRMTIDTPATLLCRESDGFGINIWPDGRGTRYTIIRSGLEIFVTYNPYVIEEAARSIYHNHMLTLPTAPLNS